MELVSAGPSFLGTIHGHIGTIDQGGHVQSVFRIHGDADAGGKLQAHLTDRTGQRNGRQQHLGDTRRFGSLSNLGKQHEELVTAMPADGVAIVQHRLQAAGDHLQHGVATGMAERVVDGSEVIQIEKEHRQAAVALTGAGHRQGQAIEHQRTVGCMRQRIALAGIGQLGEIGHRGFRDGFGIECGQNQSTVGFEQLRDAIAADLHAHVHQFLAQFDQIRPQVVSMPVE